MDGMLPNSFKGNALGSGRSDPYSPAHVECMCEWHRHTAGMAPDVLLGERFGRASETWGNTSVCDAGRDPALCFSCSDVDGLSVGMVLARCQHEEALLYRPYHAFERAHD